MITRFNGVKRPVLTFNDYISDLVVKLVEYPTENDQQLHDVGTALGLLGELEDVVNRLLDAPRIDEAKDHESSRISNLQS